MPDPGRKDLLKQLASRKILLTTRCGTFEQQSGTLNPKYILDDLVLFITTDDRYQDQTQVRHWVWMDNIAIVTEDPAPVAGIPEIER